MFTCESYSVQPIVERRLGHTGVTIIYKIFQFRIWELIKKIFSMSLRENSKEMMFNCHDFIRN